LIELRANVGSSGSAGSAGSAGSGQGGNGGFRGNGGSRTYGIHGGKNGIKGNDGHSGHNGTSGKTGKTGKTGRSGCIGNPGDIKYIIKNKSNNEIFSSPYEINYNIDIVEDGNFSDGVLAPGEKIAIQIIIENTGGMKFPEGASLTIVSDKLNPSKFEINLPEITSGSIYESILDANVSPSSANGDQLKIDSSIDFPSICKNYRTNKINQTITLPVTASCTDIFPKHLYPNKETCINLKVTNNSKISYKGVRIISIINAGSIYYENSDKKYSIDIDSIESGDTHDYKIPLITNKNITDQDIEINTKVLALESPVFEISNTSTVTPRKKKDMLIMSILGIMTLLPIQRIITDYIKIGISVFALLTGVIFTDLFYLGGISYISISAYCIYLIFQIYEIITISQGKYLDTYGNIIND